jgi:flavin-binding protein dodecin
MPVIKVIEVLGVSDKSWEDAAMQALKGATSTVRNISGIEIVSHTAKVKDGKISEYHANCKVAFRVEG